MAFVNNFGMGGQCRRFQFGANRDLCQQHQRSLPYGRIDTAHCMARTMSAGQGRQCCRARASGIDLCAWHARRLPHGRLDEATVLQTDMPVADSAGADGRQKTKQVDEQSITSAKWLQRNHQDMRKMQAFLRQALDKFLLTKGIQQSLDHHDRDRAQRLASLRLVQERLAPYGRQRVPTEGLGRCQFLAVHQAGSLAMSVDELRTLACDYIEQLPELFEGFHMGSMTDYLNYLRTPFGYGDEATLRAMAAILLRPIHIISDIPGQSNPEIITPPSSVPRNKQGPPIFIAHFREIHYEATEPVPTVEAVEDID